MAGIPKVKITFDADFDDLKKGIKGGSDEIQGFAGKVGDFGKKAGLAFAVAGAAAAAYAGKLLVEGVQSAIADEAAQAKLAKTLGNVTGATDLQVAATEAYILKTSLANGITDDVLRPSLERLVRATKDVEQAQKLQSLALDISAGSGKSLEAVSNALAKSSEGQNTALGKLGIGIDAATLKTMSFDEVTLALADTFGGQASEKADTFAGKMDRLKVAVDEGKETVGAFVLDAITPMVSFLNDNVIPVIASLSTSIGENLKPVFENISTFFTETFIPALSAMWLFIKDKIVPVYVIALKPALEGIKSVFGAVGDLIKENAGFFNLLKIALDGFWTLAKIVAPFIGGAFKLAFNGIAFIIDGISLAIKGLIAGLNLAISVVNGLISGYNIVNNLVGGKDLPKIPKLAAGGPVSSNSPYIVGEVGPELFVPSSSGKIVPNNKLSSGSTGTTINLTVNGAIDSEGTARTIINALNDSFYRGTGGSTGLVTA